MESVGLSQDHIDQVKDFTAADEDTVVRYLKHYDGNAERAISAILDNIRLPEENSVDSSWNESAWTTDNAGHAQEEAQPAFGEFLQPNAAPSRPPSRVSHRSNNGSTREASQYTPMSQEDWDVQRATKISLGQDPGPVTLPQQSGVVDLPGQTYFGPATRAQYDESKWALTRVGTTESAIEIADHPEDPFERKRSEGAPATLSPISRREKGFKPGLITILHSIPAARNALIFPSYQQGDLGQLATWYQGDEINQGVVMEDTPNLSKQDFDIILEMQRLMAFLDETQRKYARPRYLAEILDSRESTKGEYAKALDEWLSIAEKIKPDPARRNLFTTRVIYTTKGRESDFEDDICFLLELDGAIHNIYEKLNSALWPSADRRAFVRQASDIICIDIRQKQSSSQLDGLGVSVPPIIHLDRYLEENSESMHYRHMEIQEHEQTVKSLKEQIEDISSHTHSAQLGKVAGTELLEITISLLKAGQDRRERNSFEVSPSFDENVPEIDSREASTIKQLEHILDWLNWKVDGLTKQIDEHQEAIEKARQELLREDLIVPQYHRYSLRGVCIEGKKTFVLQPSVPTGSWNSSPDQDGFQWWCQDFSWSSTKDFSVSEVSLDDVLNDASNNAKEALLVYANDKARSEQTIPLPDALHNFVVQDNLLFDHEIQSHAHTTVSCMDWETAGDTDTGSTFELGSSTHPQEQEIELSEKEGEYEPLQLNITASVPPHSITASQIRSPETETGSSEIGLEDHGKTKSAYEKDKNSLDMTSDGSDDGYDEKWRAAEQGYPSTKEDELALQDKQRRLGRDLTLKERRDYLLRRLQAVQEGTGGREAINNRGGEESGWKGG
ncbi:hypothetical protein EV356DRAFT_535104 [Viridothelium virens]|uniref:UBA domain-containing protein n=1 Tax=Viridothelium virens TaxID=1048519 RepID=A0A6A6H225_VIRVR|nr:hypothetical protein EV356DRAFT_535104 [Viridothelium virens]